MNNDNRPNDNNYQSNMVNNVSSATNREHSSSKAPVSEIELFKKQLEQGIREPKDEADEVLPEWLAEHPTWKKNFWGRWYDDAECVPSYTEEDKADE